MSGGEQPGRGTAFQEAAAGSLSDASAELRPPPFLIGAALLFWGWQSGFAIAGLVMAVIFEAGRWTRSRWDLSNEDFTRIWVFCTFLFLAATIFAFTSNEGPAEFRGLWQNPTYMAQRSASTATARTAASLFRWLPLIFFLFAAAQSYSTRQGVPLETISLILRRRWKKARSLGQKLPPGRSVNISYFYFGLCLFSACVHASEGVSFFWGLCVLLAWALWSRRSQRFSIATWAVCVGMAVVLGYAGQHGIAQLQGYLGNLNPSWLGYFGRKRFDSSMSRTDFGHVGRMKASAKIVVRLQTQTGAPPPYLREASFRTFKGQTWFSEFAEKDFGTVLEDATNRNTYVLLRDKTNTLRVNIGCYLEGGKALLPLPTGVARLENLTAYTLFRSPLGAVLEEGPGLVVFDALYGPGSTIDEVADTNYDLTVPSREKATLDKVIDEAGIRRQPSGLAVKTLGAFFQEKFKYSSWQGRSPSSRTNDTPLSRFLLRTRSGHCEYFATAGALLLREAGIPARYAVGYAVHEDAGDGKFVVRQRDGHAWCLVWDDKKALWRDVDFTPAIWMQEEAPQVGWLQKLSDAWSRIRFEISRFRWGQSHLRKYLLWAVVPILLVLLYQIVRNSRKRRRRKGQGAKEAFIAWPGLDSEFYQLEEKLGAMGLPRLPSETFGDWIGRALNDESLAELNGPMRRLLQMHYRYRFDPAGISAEEREALKNEVVSVLARLSELRDKVAG